MAGHDHDTIVLFDGVCNLCNGFVRFIILRDPHGKIRFASLQSDFGQRILQELGLPADALNSVIVVEGGRYYQKSTAALKIARKLHGFWPALSAFLLVPRFMRDPLYDWLARNRYRWFGTTEACLYPRPEWKQRFFENSDYHVASNHLRNDAGN